MKIIPSSRRNRYIAGVGIVLVVVALIVGLVIWLSAPSYGLTIASTAGGSVTTPGEAGPYTYDEGTVVSLVVEADAGYHFVNWTGDVDTVTDTNAAVTNITMNGDYSIAAEFVKQYDLTISSTGGGSVTTPGEGTFDYDKGTVVNLVATPDAGYQFVEWTGDVDTIGNVNAAITIITTNGNYSITANFVALYDLTISSTEGGSVTTPGEGTFDYDKGTVVNLVATPDTGYGFVEWTGDVDTIGNVNGAITIITTNGDYTISANFAPYMVAAGWDLTVGLKTDGTVVALGRNDDGQCDVGGWTDIIQVTAGSYHTVGLTNDGTVVAVGVNYYGQCDVGGWTDIIQVTAGSYHTVGLTNSGTVVAVGRNAEGQCNVGSWTGITQVAAGRWHTVGLKTDGTVVAVGDNDDGQCNVAGWTGIVQVTACGHHTVGLKSDGTVVAVGDNTAGKCNVGSWTDITQVAAGYYHTVGLKSDGTVVTTAQNVVDWTDIIQVAAGEAHTVGLKADGTVIAVGLNDYGQCNVGGWTLK
jgi:hypothetical protein